MWQPDLCDDDGTVETATTGATWECDDVGNWFGSLRKKEEEKDDLREEEEGQERLFHVGLIH